MNIRDAKIEDLAAIVDIYNQSIPDRLATADTEPVTLESKLSWYRDRSCNRPLWVATSEDRVLGWLSFQNFYGRPAYLHTAEISIYVGIEHRRQGVAHKLLALAIAFCPKLELTTLLAFVFAHNQPSIDLFTRYGFERWGYLPDVAVLDEYNRSLAILGKKVSS